MVVEGEVPAEVVDLVVMMRTDRGTLQPTPHPHQPPTRLPQLGLVQHAGIERQQFPNCVPNWVVHPTSHADSIANTRSRYKRMFVYLIQIEPLSS